MPKKAKRSNDMENYDNKNAGRAENEGTPPDMRERDIFERTSHYDPLMKKEPASVESCKNENELSGDIKIQSPFMKKLENFFYHYKWHTIIAAFFVFILALCVFQTCKKTSYDAYIMYAGGKNLRTMEEGETESTFVILYKTMGFYVGDYDEDGEKNVSFSDIFLPSADEIKKLEEEGNAPYTLLGDNDELFRNNMLSGNYYVCLLSEYLFNEWTKNDNNPFVSITDYLPEGAKIANVEGEDGYRLASDCGVYLSSTPLKDEPGFKYLPDDTIICLRKFSKASTPGRKGENIYKNSEKLLCALLKGEIE